MNKLIQELEKQAFDAVWDLDNTTIGPPTHFVPDGFEKKLAELIVKECMKLNRDILCEDDPDYLDKIYKEHFGVEQ